MPDKVDRTCWILELDDRARVCKVETYEDLLALFREYHVNGPNFDVDEWVQLAHQIDWQEISRQKYWYEHPECFHKYMAANRGFDWTRIASDFDVFWWTTRAEKEERHWYPGLDTSGWDCETVLVFNVTVVKVLERKCCGWVPEQRGTP